MCVLICVPVSLLNILTLPLLASVAATYVSLIEAERPRSPLEFGLSYVVERPAPWYDPPVTAETVPSSLRISGVPAGIIPVEL